MNATSRRAGFTLFEMSIVLIVIGLITGGIIEGKTLIRAAQLRSVEKDYRRYLAAFNAFEVKYHALPGDMANADQFWPLANSNPQACRNTVSAAATTCDGNGSGTIDQTIDGSLTGSEMYHAWKQLQLAGLIEGQYSGHDASTTNDILDAKVNNNVPGSGVDSAGFLVFYEGTVPDNTNLWQWPLNYGHQMQYKLYSATAAYTDGGPVISPAELQTIDTKIDDGLPATGKVVSNKPGASGWQCTTTSIPTTAAYNLTVTDNECSIDFVTGF